MVTPIAARLLSNKTMGDLTENFSYDEVRCPCGCGNANISKEMMNRLQVIRTALDPQKFIVASGVRCKEHNLSVGGVEDSEHVPNEFRPGEGIDIKCEDSVFRWKLIGLGILIFKRVGIGDGFVHFGVRPTKPQRVLWDYYQK